MNRTTRTMLVLALAVAVAGVAAFAVYRAIVNMPVQQVEVAQIQVAVAAQEIRVGTIVTQEKVKLVGWPAGSPVQGSFNQVEPVVGRAVTASISQNEPITESKLASKDAGAGLPPTIPVGLRAMSIRVDDVIGVAGFVVPGTHVDIIATLPTGQERAARVIVSNVLVLAAGTKYDQDAPKKDGQPIPTTTVTVVVTPQDAENIALAQNEGRLMLALRNPGDDLPANTTGVRLPALLGAPAAPPIEKINRGRKVMIAAPKPDPGPAVAKAYTVEAIRGSKRTEESVVK